MDVLTARLRLRDLRVEDRDPMVDLWTDAAVARFMDDFGPRTAAQTDDWIRATLAANRERERSSHNSTILLRSTGAVVGWIGVGVSSAPVGDYDFGYAVRPGHRGHGYATEALVATLRFCFTDLAVASVWGECHADNAASARVMSAACMSRIADNGGSRRYLARRDSWLGVSGASGVPAGARR